MADVSKEVAALFPAQGNDLWVGLAIGLLAGAVGAGLLSPRSGALNREMLRERGLELKDRADEFLRNRTSRSPL